MKKFKTDIKEYWDLIPITFFRRYRYLVIAYMTEENTILYKSKSFVLGVCDCGCKEEISIRSKHRGNLQRFKTGHNLKIHQYSKRGPEHSHWKEGRRIEKKGYVSIYSPDHPYRDKNDCVREHRLVMEQHLGRYLNRNEPIHHRNKNRYDNRIENLQLITHLEHMIITNSKDLWNRVCSRCGSAKTHTVKRKMGLRPFWCLDPDTKKPICKKCYLRLWRSKQTK